MSVVSVRMSSVEWGRFRWREGLVRQCVPERCNHLIYQFVRWYSGILCVSDGIPVSLKPMIGFCRHHDVEISTPNYTPDASSMSHRIAQRDQITRSSQTLFAIHEAQLLKHAAFASRYPCRVVPVPVE